MGDEMPKADLNEMAKGGGGYINASTLPARGAEFTVESIAEPETNFKKTRLIPVLLLTDGHGPAMKYKVSQQVSAQKLLDAGILADLSNIKGRKLWLIPVGIKIAGEPKTIAQIAEVIPAKD